MDKLCLLVVVCAAAYATGASPRCSGPESPVVAVRDQGLVRGRKAQDGNYYQFTGIPYATASKDNRFKSPLPLPRWEGVREADRDVACAQYDEQLEQAVGQEDCLVLNVYTANLARPPQRRLPVMVFIHGGGYNQGSAEHFIYGPKRFMEENVVLVTFNYRLGIFGFLCTGKYANAGLKDAVAVLEWVKTNIKNFGGDPNKVTIFGESAGSAMVEMLVLSKRAKGLFGGAICQSGVTSSSWAFGSDPEEKARRVAKELGYEGENHEIRIRTLKNASMSELVKATEKLALMTPYEFLPVSPCVEPIIKSDSVITSHPADIIKSGQYNDVPMIIGFNKDEAMLLYGTVITYPRFLESLNDDFLHTLPEDLQTLQRADEISNMTQSYYFGNVNISDENMPQAVEYFTDVIYMMPTVQNARGYIKSGKKSPLYMYQFAYDGGMPFLKMLLNITHIPGVCHGDELGYMFTQTGQSLVRADDLLLARQLVNLWTNFAKCGNPTPNGGDGALMPVRWAPVTDHLDYLLIDRRSEMRQKPFPKRVNFWDNIYSTFTSPITKQS